MRHKVVRRLRGQAQYLGGRAALALGVEPIGTHKVFVVGCGRSGTHWVGLALKNHPDFHADLEEQPVFDWVVELARRPGAETKYFEPLADRYRALHALRPKRHFVDKSHPNLWLAEKLAGTFPEARFIAIRRKLLGTVASMLRHKGTRTRVDVWDRNPAPDRLLGVDHDLLDTYRTMSTPARCAVRVIAHSREIDRLQENLKGRIIVIEYENLQLKCGDESARLCAFLNVQAPLTFPEPHVDSMRKWKMQLAPSELREVIKTAEQLRATDLLEPDYQQAIA